MITTSSEDRKEIPVFTGFMKYFPLAIIEVARLSMVSNAKHNPGEPLRWSKDKSNDHGDCIGRHQLQFDELDDDDFYHAVKVAWRAMAQLEILLEESAPPECPELPDEVLPLYVGIERAKGPDMWAERMAANVFNRAFTDTESPGCRNLQDSPEGSLGRILNDEMDKAIAEELYEAKALATEAWQRWIDRSKS